MTETFKKILPFAFGAGAAGMLDVFLVEGVGTAGVIYDLTHDGYFADLLNTGDPSELLDIHEMNAGEIISALAIMLSFFVVLITWRHFSRKVVV